MRTCQLDQWLHDTASVAELVSGKWIAAEIPENTLLEKKTWRDTTGRETEGRMISYAVQHIYIFREGGVVKVGGLKARADDYKKTSKGQKLFVERVTGLQEKEIEKLAVALRGKRKAFAYELVALAVKGKNDIEGTRGVFMPAGLTLRQSMEFLAQPGLVPTTSGTEQPDNVFLIPVANLEFNGEEKEGLKKCRDYLMEKVSGQVDRERRNRQDARNARNKAMSAPTINQKPSNTARAPKVTDNTCLSCKGTGHSSLACSQCNGTGHIGGKSSNPACSVCHGSGFTRCDSCKGTGHYE